MANAISDLKLPQADPDYMVGGDGGDGTDLFGIAAYRGSQEPLTEIWDDPPQLAALIAKEEAIEIEAEMEEEMDTLNADFEMMDDGAEELFSYQERDDFSCVVPTGSLGKELVAAQEASHDTFVSVEAATAEDDTRQGGIVGLRRAACMETGVWSVGDWVNRTRPDTSRGQGQRVKQRARRAASVSKAKLKESAIAA